MTLWRQCSKKPVPAQNRDRLWTGTRYFALFVHHTQVIGLGAAATRSRDLDIVFPWR